MGSTVSCGGSTGAGHVRLGAASGPFSQRPPLQLTTLKTLQGHPVQCQTPRSSWKEIEIEQHIKVSNLSQKSNTVASSTRSYRLERGKRGKQPLQHNIKLWVSRNSRRELPLLKQDHKESHFILALRDEGESLLNLNSTQLHNITTISQLRLQQ